MTAYWIRLGRADGIQRWVPSLGVAVGFAGVLALAYVLLFWFQHGAWPGDTYTYYLAGERLNRGHQIYDLAVDDWWYADRAFPLYSPPLIAVIWRPLAAMPGQLGVLVWWIAMAFCALYALALLLVATKGWSGLLMLPLAPATGLLIGVGNIDAFVLLGTVGVWMLDSAGHDRRAGALLGLMISLKLTPAVLLVWLLLRRRWTPVFWASVAMLALALVSIVGSHPGVFVRYAEVMYTGASSGRPWALALLVAGGLLLVALRHRPLASYALSVALMPIGSPQAALHSLSLLQGCLSPAVRPQPTSEPSSPRWPWFLRSARRS